MVQYNYKRDNEYPSLRSNQVLSSLVVNVPYGTDSFNTAPKISKVLSFPFGLRIDVQSLVWFSIKTTISMILLMIVTSVLVTSLSFPVQNQNFQLLSNAKSLSNQKLLLLAKLQEQTNYNKIFSLANQLSMHDTTDVVYLNREKLNLTANSGLSIKKYPSLQFAGF